MTVLLVCTLLLHSVGTCKSMPACRDQCPLSGRARLVLHVPSYRWHTLYLLLLLLLLLLLSLLIPTCRSNVHMQEEYLQVHATSVVTSRAF